MSRNSAMDPLLSRVAVRWNGPVSSLTAADRQVLFDRSTSSDGEIRARTAEIVEAVRRHGDAALLELARSLDGVALESLEVSRAACTRALDALEPSLRQALDRAADNIAKVHRAFLPTPQEATPEPGVVIGRRPDPLGRVGVYAPGGRATYPSSVLMGAVPARISGVGEIVLCSPPTADGSPTNVLLAAAAIAGVDRVFAIGGAGAVAAMAYGTGTVPRVDRIVGPGNAYVAEAKLQVAGAVAIDSPAGPSELLVMADETCDPHTVAVEMLAQAEHDPRACVVAVVVGESVAHAVADALDREVAAQPRATIIREALAGRGGVMWTHTLENAVSFANEYAPEHLLLATAHAELLLPSLRNAGTVFVGEAASVAFGDYMTGANHVLPTGGLARCYSGLSVLDFMRWTTYQRVSAQAASRLATDVAAFADAESLPGHAAAARRAGGGA